MKRIVFAKKIKGVEIMGVGVENALYLVEGKGVPVQRGGGRIKSMELIGELVYIRKVNDDGTPCRDFGTHAQGETRVPLVSDGVAVPVNQFVGLLFDDVQETTAAEPGKQEPAPEPARQPDVPQDPPAAKPVQKPAQQQGNARR